MNLPAQKQMRFRWPGGFWRSLFSILIGNAIYYGLVDYLPGSARHEPFAPRLGAGRGLLDLCMRLRPESLGLAGSERIDC